MRNGSETESRDRFWCSSLTPEVSWAGPVVFSLTVLNIYICVCVHVPALLSIVPWAPLYLLSYKFTEMPLVAGRASRDIPVDKP